jgi:hypothetical protein
MFSLGFDPYATTKKLIWKLRFTGVDEQMLTILLKNSLYGSSRHDEIAYPY